MQTTRLFEILYILLSKERITAKELANRFEVSTRTIYRDIETISMAGIPLYTEKGKGGGIRIMPDFIMNKSLLNDNEQEEILSSLQGLAQMKIAQSDTTLEKLSATFGKTATDWLEVDFSDWGYDNTEIFAVLKTAILKGQIIEFGYLNPTGETSFRQVEPLKLWFKSRAWYLKAFCLLRGDARTFKLTRIRNLTLTNEHFIKRDEPIKPEQVVTEAASVAPVLINFEFSVAPIYAHRIIDDFGGGVLQEDGSYLVKITCPEEDWLYGLILSYGEHIEVLAPAFFRGNIHDKIKKINEKYS